ncbi:hypothetical protein CRG98_044992, partial [Punica granatum]
LCMFPDSSQLPETVNDIEDSRCLGFNSSYGSPCAPLARGDGMLDSITSSRNDSAVRKQIEDSWRNLIKYPEEWSDYRKAKLDRLVRLIRNSQILNATTNLLLSGITRHPGDEACKDLVENPDKWWDNRSNNKPKSTYPEFKHKEMRQALWLDSSPSRVLSNLPPLKPPEKAASRWMKTAPSGISYSFRGREAGKESEHSPR